LIDLADVPVLALSKLWMLFQKVRQPPCLDSFVKLHHVADVQVFHSSFNSQQFDGIQQKLSILAQPEPLQRQHRYEVAGEVPVEVMLLALVKVFHRWIERASGIRVGEYKPHHHIEEIKQLDENHERFTEQGVLMPIRCEMSVDEACGYAQNVDEESPDCKRGGSMINYQSVEAKIF
jgi:hypothetical protein